MLKTSFSAGISGLCGGGSVAGGLVGGGSVACSGNGENSRQALITRALMASQMKAFFMVCSS
jgi:hypothetical protein